MKKIAIAFAVLTFSLIVYPLPQARATTPGIYFDHIVIIAFENQNLNAIFGSPNAPFINSMLSGGSYTTAYSVDQTGCSAACYLQMTSGSNQGKSDGYCPRANSPCLTVSNLFSLFDSFNGLTYQAYCEFDSTQSPTTCPRGADHFPFIAYSNANPGSNGGCFLAGNCANIFGGTASSCSGHSCTSADFVSAANAVTPPNFLWYTPSDCNNMHGQTSNCANGCASSDSTCFVQQGDSYLQNFLIGTGTLSNPATGSLFASNAFSTGMRTLFVLWFDENSNPPELFYGTQVHQGFVSSMTYTHYGVLRTIEQNWGLGIPCKLS